MHRLITLLLVFLFFLFHSISVCVPGFSLFRMGNGLNKRFRVIFMVGFLRLVSLGVRESALALVGIPDPLTSH